MSFKINLNPHYELDGKHAFMAPSSPAWTEYDDDKLIDAYRKSKAKEMGTRLHAHAAEAISLRRQQRGHSDTFSMYVNDAIGYHMKPEVALFAHEKCFGHSDALSFDGRTLRIFDLKTGLVIPGKMRQLEVYAALFCLEYGIDPHAIKFDLRIYQFDNAVCYEPDPDDIEELMYDKIIHGGKILTEIDYEETI